MSSGTYVHIPFCEQLCHYCAFPVVVMPESDHQPYVESLSAEISGARLPETTDTLYLEEVHLRYWRPTLWEPSWRCCPRGRGRFRSKPIREL